MQNTTRFAEDIRAGVDNLLDAMSSEGNIRIMHAKVAGQYLNRAADERQRDNSVEADFVDKLSEILEEIRSMP